MRSWARVLARGAFGGALVASTAFCGGAAFQADDSVTPGDGGLDALGALDGVAANDGAPPSDGAAPPLDGSVPPIDGAVIDGAASDGAVDDGAAIDGATIDAAGDGATAVFACSALQNVATTIFCDDFDQGASVGSHWSAPLAVNGSNAYDTTSFVSTPRAYASVTNATVNAAFANLHETLTTTASSLDLAFSIYVKQLDTSVAAAAITVGRLAIGRLTTHGLVVDLLLDKNGLHLSQSTTASDGGTLSQENSVAGALPAATWTRVQIIVDERPATWTVKVMVDAAVGLSTTAIAQPADTSIEADVGIVFVPPPSTGNAITYDNVLLHSL